MESGVFTFVLLCTVWLNVEALTVSIPQKVYDVPRGGNATIPCTFKTTVQNPTSAAITWSRRPNQPDTEYGVILTYYYPYKSFDLWAGFDPERFSIEADVQKGQADLLLKSLKFEDSMLYECHVQVRGDTTGKPDAITNVVVLVPPTKPIISVQGKPEYGQNINLTCVSEEASPPPTYKWDSYDVQNNLRTLDPKSTVKGGILSLFNVTKETSGYYVCTATNKVGSASTNYTLSVMPPSLNIGSTAGIIGGVAAALILLVIIICCCYCRKKKQQEEAYVMGAPVYTDKDPDGNDENPHPEKEESSLGFSDSKGPINRRDQYQEKTEHNDDRRRDYDDRRSDIDDRRRDYDDRRSDIDDRRRDYDDRRSDIDDRRRDYDDRRSDFDDQRSNYSDRRDKYSDRNERYDDDRHYNDERRYDDRRGQR